MIRIDNGKTIISVCTRSLVNNSGYLTNINFSSESSNPELPMSFSGDYYGNYDDDSDYSYKEKDKDPEKEARRKEKMDKVKKTVKDVVTGKKGDPYRLHKNLAKAGAAAAIAASIAQAAAKGKKEALIARGIMSDNGK